MQKVAWPTMIVQIENVMPPKLKKALSGSPGRASGSMNRRLMASRPKNVVRWIAKAAHEPRRRARAVAASPACKESTNAERTSESFHVAVNHLKVRPAMGQLSMFDVLKA